MKLSIVIPAYNEEQRIGKTLRYYTIFFNKVFGKSYEILVVLNGCRDDTLGVVARFAKNNKQVRFVDIKEAIGKGGAIIQGFKVAKGDLIGFVDADGSTMAESFYDLVKNIDDYGGVIASRWLKGARITHRQPILKRFGSRGFNLLTRLLFSLKFKDTQCGAKLFTKKVVLGVTDELSLTKWAFDVNLLYACKKKGYKIREIATRWDAAGASHFNLFKAMPEMFLGLVRLRLIYSPFNFLVKIYDRLPNRLKLNYYIK